LANLVQLKVSETRLSAIQDSPIRPCCYLLLNSHSILLFFKTKSAT